MIIKKTKPISGDLLAQQLSIDPKLIYDDGNGNIVINAELDVSIVNEAIKTHTIPVPPEPTLEAKLQRAGITLDELREALGL